MSNKNYLLGRKSNNNCIGVNFINILRARFSYESAFLSLHFGKKALLYEKRMRKMLMKLTPEGVAKDLTGPHVVCKN